MVANRPVEPLNIGVLLWLALRNVFKLDSLFLGPVLNRATDVLWPVVAANDLRLATPEDDLLQRPDHPITRSPARPLAGQSEVTSTLSALPLKSSMTLNSLRFRNRPVADFRSIRSGDRSAAVAAVDCSARNSRSRSHCSHQGVSGPPVAMTAIEGVADLALTLGD